MKRLLKIMIFFITFISLCNNINAKTYSGSIKSAEEYLKNQYDLKNTYSRYLLEIPGINNTNYYDNYDNSSLNFKYGGFLSEKEFNVTKRNKNNNYSYLYEIDEFWTLTKGAEPSTRKVISKITSDVNTEETFPKTKVTEYVQNTSSVVGTGEFSDPWIFVPQYEVILKVNNPEKGKLINPVYPYDEVDYVKMYISPGGANNIKIEPKGIYQYLGNTCGHIINDASIRSKTENKLIVHEVTRDFECTINFGERPLKVGIDNDVNDTNDNEIKNIYMLPNKAWYSDEQGQNQINVVNDLPSKDGYTTEGFYLEKNYTISFSGECTGKQYIDGAGNIKIKANSTENTIRSDTKLYPCYRPNKYVITYDCNNGKTNDTRTSEHIFSEDPVLINNFCEKEGYKFVGWNTDPAGTGIKYLPGKQVGKNITDEATVTLYAQWEALLKLTATFDKNGASSLSDTSLYCYTESAATGCKITTPTITPASGFDVVGFNESASATSKTVDAGVELVLNSNKTYYAITKSTNKIKVTFEKNGSESTTTTKECTRYNGSASCEITSPAPTPRSGYTIIGYGLSANATAKEWEPNTKKYFSSDKTYYVLQSKIITASFDKNGASSIGATSESCTLYNADTSCQIITPKITPVSGFNSIGWNTNKNATEKSASQNVTTNISADTTYYAITNKEIVANFNLNGASTVGEAVKKCYVYNGSTAGCKITTPSITGISGFSPVGWNTNQNATSSTWDVNAEKVITSNTTYYAITKKTIKTTFDANGGSVSPTSASCYLYNGSTGTCSVTLPTATRSYSNFWGWNTKSDASGTNYNAGSSYNASKNTTLYANWELLHMLPIFTYTGKYQLVEDNDTVIYEGTNVKVVIPSEYSKYRGNWKIRFLSDGTITFHELRSASNGIDVFLVGGGGNGGSTYSNQAGRNGYAAGGGGGGGGYRTTKKGVSVSATSYSIDVGAARAKSTAFGQTANPGNNGSGGYADLASCEGGPSGGTGGASGGAGIVNLCAPSNRHGSAGGKEFGESQYSKYYGGGGGGGHGHNGEVSYTRGNKDVGVGTPGNGGTGGGGTGNNQYRGANTHNGAANTGGGGGGASFVFDRYDAGNGCWSSDGCFNVSRTTQYPAGTGGSGIVIIRNKR